MYNTLQTPGIEFEMAVKRRGKHVIIVLNDVVTVDPIQFSVVCIFKM